MAKQEELERQIQELEDLEKQGKKPKKSKKTIIKYIINISVVLIATGVALFLSLKDNFNTIVSDLTNSDYRWILVVFGLVLVSIFFKGLVLFCFARLYTRNYHLHQGLAVYQIGVFYNAVTPGASGGEIMEAYTYKKQGVPISSAVSIMAMYSIIYQSVLILYGLLSLIIKYDFISKMDNLVINLGNLRLSLPIWVLTILGFVLNVSVILIVLLMAYWKRFHRFMMGPVIGFLSRIKLVKNADKSRENLRVQVENFKIEFRRLLTNIPFTILMAVFFFVALTAYFSIPYFVGLALGNESTVATFWDAVFLSNYHQMVTGLIPIPGSAGVSELFFHELFINDFLPNSFYLAQVNGVPDVPASEAMCKAALLLWRSITFAFPLIIAGFVTAFYKASPKGTESQHGDIPNRRTLTELQAQTLAERHQELDTIIETSTLTRQAVLARLKATSEKRKNTMKNKQEQPHERGIDDININDDEDY